MTIMLDQVGRLLRGERSAHAAGCVVCRRPIRRDEHSMTVRGSVQAHQRCATYRMRQVNGGVRRAGYPPR